MEGVVIAALFVLSLLPPFLFALYIRRRERHDREPLGAVVGAFIFGGTLGVAIAIFLHVLFAFGYGQAGNPLNVPAGFLAAVIIAPIVEELGKALGLGGVRRNINELEDGIIYGAALGLGFAATENLTYAATALFDGGVNAALGTVLMRTFSSMLLHTAASALIGYGFSKMVVRGGVVWSLIPFYLGAVVLHAAYNFLVSAQIVLGLIAAIAMVIAVLTTLTRHIEELDRLPHQIAR